MEERVNLTYDDVITIIGLFDIEPRHNDVIITLNTEETDNDLVLADDTMSDKQYIISKSEWIKDLEPGDRVILNLDKMMVREPNPENAYEPLTRIKIEPIYFNGYMFAIVDDRVIKAKYKNQ